MSSDVPALMSRAMEIIAKVGDENLADKVMVVQGYTDLGRLYPPRGTYQRELRKAVEELRTLVDDYQIGTFTSTIS